MGTNVAFDRPPVKYIGALRPGRAPLCGPRPAAGPWVAEPGGPMPLILVVHPAFCGPSPEKDPRPGVRPGAGEEKERREGLRMYFGRVRPSRGCVRSSITIASSLPACGHAGFCGDNKSNIKQFNGRNLSGTGGLCSARPARWLGLPYCGMAGLQLCSFLGALIPIGWYCPPSPGQAGRLTRWHAIGYNEGVTHPAGAGPARARHWRDRARPGRMATLGLATERRRR
jgi:hypothetical protein